MWFIPVRVHSNARTFVVEAKSEEEAFKLLKENELYYKNYNPTKDYQTTHGLPDVFMLEDEFYENNLKHSSLKQTRFPERVLPCKSRYENEKYGEYFCKGMKEVSASNKYCIIHDPHYKFNLPKDCPYLKKESCYVSFIDDEE
jgi:hypothetical protein